MKDLFDFAEQNPRPGQSLSGPLAHRMRPRNLEQFRGQERILGPQKPLRRWIENDRVPSLILWGPPGCGKTTLARIIAEHTQSDFESLSAVLSGVKEIKEAVGRAQEVHRMSQRKTFLFIDEIHRFNKSQQDALLPHVEDGTITLIGATTENPSFEINSALLSRSRVIRLERLDTQAICQALRRAIVDPIYGLAGAFNLSEDALLALANNAQGDVRQALTALEEIALYFNKEETQGTLDLTQVQEALESTRGTRPILYDKNGEEHYNVVSAFIKSIRDSDPHAGLYYLARMLEGGEDPLFIVRRLVILASEDIGNADPRALSLAIATKEAVAFVGMPEARINLAQAVTYLALAPKSNASYVGINEALEEVKKSGALPVPMHLRNAVTGLMKAEGYGKNYRYAHSESGARPMQTHLPDPLVGTRYYQPKDVGLEKQLKLKLDLLNPDFEAALGTRPNTQKHPNSK